MSKRPPFDMGIGISKKFIVAIICLVGLHLYKEKGKRDFKMFFSSDLSGRITYLYVSSGGERFKLNSSQNEYKFFSRVSKRNNDTFFSSEAEIGDSLFKQAFSDTLTLIKKTGEIYKYPFQKIE